MMLTKQSKVNQNEPNHLPSSHFIIIHGVPYRLPIDRPLHLAYCSHRSIMLTKACSTASEQKKMFPRIFNFFRLAPPSVICFSDKLSCLIETVPTSILQISLSIAIVPVGASRNMVVRNSSSLLGLFLYFSLPCAFLPT